MTLTKHQVTRFQTQIFTWWNVHKRDLPWRHTRNPYDILISEVMLQQTQVSRVLPKYAEFLIVYPNVSALAAASTRDVLILWRGLGYNRRALYLKKTAEEVVRKYKGKFPEDEKLLIELSGLGTYTARALLVFAFEKNVAMVDTNIRQIITHFFFNGKPQKEKIIQETAEVLLPHGKSWQWHQALMDYGSLELPKLKPNVIKKRSVIVPFKESNRYYRGRIIDVLRVKKSNLTDLITLLVNTYKKPHHFFEKLVDSLEQEGLVICSGKDIMLPL